ncbi:MAG: transporter substrate-binding domain-containing protein, partial [Nannocystaceae bacterium]|nr:transporter substrate-binding domain-containing protein [Nannocystaceae bacterium]
HMVEDVRFTTYKCWDEYGDLSGFDIEMITQAAHEAGFDFIEFVPRPWSSYPIEDREYLSLLIDLVVGVSDGLSAGMSITEERLAVVDMVGPIYKAGKKLMARTDNARISEERLGRLLEVPTSGYDALAGLSVVTQAPSIRSDFFRELEATHPDLVEYLEVDADGQITTLQSEDTLQVLEVDEFSIINDFIDGQMSDPIHGRVFDFVMIDTGSTKSLIDEGKLGIDTDIVTGNLSADPEIGRVFGTGDGISFAKTNTAMTGRFRPIIARMVLDGRVDALVEQWFADDNAADPSWATALE